VDADVVCIASVAAVSRLYVSGSVGEGERMRRCCGFDLGGTYARYATAKEGSVLKWSDSMKRSRRFQLIWDGSLGRCDRGLRIYGAFRGRS